MISIQNELEHNHACTMKAGTEINYFIRLNTAKNNKYTHSLLNIAPFYFKSSPTYTAVPTSDIPEIILCSHYAVFLTYVLRIRSSYRTYVYERWLSLDRNLWHRFNGEDILKISHHLREDRSWRSNQVGASEVVFVNWPKSSVLQWVSVGFIQNMSEV